MSNTALHLNVVSDGNACPTSTRPGFGHSGNQSHSHNQSSYRPRSLRNTAFHKLVEDNFEELELIVSDGYFNENGDFLFGISPKAEDLTAPFAKAVLKMLKKEKVINPAVINNISTWQHSGFNVHCGSSASFSDIEAVERLARYIVRAPISQEHLEYYPPQDTANDSGNVIYEGKTTGKVETFSAIDFLARLVTHIPNKREQTVRYYGHYSNKSRGVRAKA